MNGSSLFPGPGGAASGSTLDGFPSPLHLTAESPVHLPDELPASFETDSLPGSRGLPVSVHRCACGAGHSRVRYVLRGF